MSIRDFFHYTLRLLFYFSLLLVTIVVAAWFYLQNNIIPELPETDSIRDIRLQVPLRIYTQDNAALAEFGEERRTPLAREDIPPLLVKAVLAAEDARFYEHFGVDLKGIARAGIHFLKTARKEQGASTITMQLARNIYDEKIGSAKTFERKFKEILTAIQIEKELDKDEILRLYLNKIFLGHRSYGMAAAAQVYYGQPLQALTLAQYAMLAGLPKAPSTYNPISNPQRALIRRNYVLQRMYELGDIEEAAYLVAKEEPVTAQRYTFSRDFDAPYIAEMVRIYMQENYPDDVYSGGYKVYTSINTRLQSAAQAALRKAVQDYDHRHGYRGAVGQVDLAHLQLTEAMPGVAKLPLSHAAAGDVRLTWKSATPTAEYEMPMTQKDLWLSALENYQSYVDLQPALVVAIEEKSALVLSKEGEPIVLDWSGLSWARRYISDTRQTHLPKQASDVLALGDVVMIQPIENAAEATETSQEAVTGATQAAIATLAEDEAAPKKPQKWRLSQIPQVAGALVSLDSKTGAIIALAGGFNYHDSTFNRAIQAKRQPGSNFKPFIYSAALEHGYTPASIINDAPVVFHYGRKTWRPENYGHQFQGPIRLRKALAKSKNLVSVRLMQDMGVKKTLAYVTRFGFRADELPPNLTLSLGTPELTPLQIASGFAVFSNGGYRVEPYFIERIEDYHGNVIYRANPKTVCYRCNLPLTPPLHRESEDENLDLAGLAALLEEHERAKLLPETIQETVPYSPIFTAHESDTKTPQYAPRVITAQNAWLMTSILKSVIQEGTAQRAKRLKRNDLAGKTGTTNEQRDAWFSGYNHAIATTAWLGFDQPRSLGRTVMGSETGGSAALPMWINYMQEALKDMPEQNMPMPADIVKTHIDPDSGLLAYSGQDNAMTEYFHKNSVPIRYAQPQPESFYGIEQNAVTGSTDQLF